jgi:RND family efflux transporter MFP subunit
MKRPYRLLFLCALATPAFGADLDAQVEWSRRTELAMPVSGAVANVAVRAGERVAKDQALVALDAVPFAAAVTAAEAQLVHRRVERDEAARDLRQTKELFDRTVASAVELENAQHRQQRADADYREAVAGIERARYRLQRSILRAPFAARVLSSRAEVGQSVAAELTPPVLMVIAADGEFLARARCSAERAASFKPGQAVQVSVAGKNYAARINAVNYDPVGNKEPYVVDAVFATTDALNAGQSARIVAP